MVTTTRHNLFIFNFNMYTLLKKTVIFLIVTTLIISVIDRLVIQDELIHTTHKRLFKDKEKFDFIFMGNSLSQRSYDVNYLDSVMNTKSLNIGGSAQYFFITNEIFNNLVKNKDFHPSKLLVISISPYAFRKSESKTWKHLQMAGLDELKYSKNYFSLVKELYTVDEYPKVFSSTIRFHSDFSENLVESNNKLKHFKKDNADGFELNVTNKLNESQRKQRNELNFFANNFFSEMNKTHELKISEKSEEVLLNIIDKCKQNNINLLFITPPAIDMLYDKNIYGNLKYFETLFKTNEVDYLNLNYNFNELNLGYDDYSDFSHLNKFGSKKITPFILEKILQKFEITINKTSKKVKNKIKLKKIINEEITIPDYRTWVEVRLNLENNLQELNNKEVYHIKRNSITEPSYMVTKTINVNSGDNYFTEVIVKKGENSDFFGLRIQGAYPNRVDAVFDLKNGEVEGVEKGGDFKNGEAYIENLGEGWYKCKLVGKINSKDIRIIFGPTSNEKIILGWEGKIESLNDIYILPSSLKVFMQTEL